MEVSESPPPSISTTDPLPPSLLFFTANFHNLIPIKLTQHNYAIWKLQCEGALKVSSLFDYIQDHQPPSQTIVDSNGNSIDNPAFYTWFVVDNHVRSCLIATLTPEIFTQVINASTARDLWVFLKYKFEKEPILFERFDLDQQCSGVVVCQICANKGHGAFDCPYRFEEESSQPANNANKVFDESPRRDALPIADRFAISCGNTGSDTVTKSPGMTVLYEPELSVSNQSDSRFVKDRLALPVEEKFACHTRQGSGNFEPFQIVPGPQISETRPKKNHSGRLKRKATSSDPSSHPSKKIKTVCFPANSELSAGHNNDIGLSPNESGNAVEHTRTADDHIQNSNDSTVVCVGTADVQTIQNSQEIHVGVNSFQVKKQLKSGKDVDHTVTTGDQKIQNSPEIEVERNSLLVNKQLNGDKAIESTLPVRPGRWISWSRPPPGKVALHFDGSVRDGSAAGGGVFRDHEGLFMGAFSVHLGPGSPNEAEAKALQAGLLFAHAHGITVDCIYGDSNEVVQALIGPVNVRERLRRIKPIIDAIKNVLSVTAVIAHTPRQGNQVADALAAIGHYLLAGSFQSYLFPEQLPQKVKWLLLQDCHDFVYFRPLEKEKKHRCRSTESKDKNNVDGPRDRNTVENHLVDNGKKHEGPLVGT